MNIHLVCNRNKKHTFDSPTLFVAQSCPHLSKKTSRCIGFMTIDEDAQKHFGLSKEEVARLAGFLIFSQIVGLPLKRVTPAASRGKKLVWIASSSGNPKEAYFRCAACGKLNLSTFAPNARGECNVCEICSECGVHQFVILEGWSEYQEEKRKKT